MKSHRPENADRKLTLKKETLRQLRPDELRHVEGGAVTNAGTVCQLVSLALSCEIIRCF